QVGDLVVYFEIDCFIPKDARFWELFAQPTATEVFRGKEGFRVKSRWFKNHLSQGLIWPLREFDEIYLPFEARAKVVGEQAAFDELRDKSFADLFGVVKWEYPESAKDLEDLGPAPGFIRMPGWRRIQDVEETVFCNKNLQKEWQITEKLDGVTMTVYKISRNSKWARSLPDLPADCPPTMQKEQSRYGVCIRQRDFVDRDDNLYWQAARQSGALDGIQKIDMPNVAVQGEFCGSSVLRNSMQYPDGEHEFVVFAIWDIDKARYLGPRETVELCDKLGIKHVPVVGYVALGGYARDTKELLEKAEGRGRFGGVREGLVFRALDGSGSFKVISNSWLRLWDA
ncbi:uncharacterized protein THITE_34535, partial [Thermothielavioides terrestris NRRL 8126]